jgi:hypothetical protein
MVNQHKVNEDALVLSCTGVYTCGLPWRAPAKYQEEEDRSFYMILLVSILGKAIMS